MSETKVCPQCGQSATRLGVSRAEGEHPDVLYCQMCNIPHYKFIKARPLGELFQAMGLTNIQISKGTGRVLGNRSVS